MNPLIPVLSTSAFSPSVIAIDGPAASGKSTIGFKIANLTDFLFFDTGIMYRAVTLAVLNNETDPKDEPTVGKIAQTIEIDIQAPDVQRFDNQTSSAEEASDWPNRILVDGQNVTAELRTPKVDQRVSLIAANPLVRDALTAHQRRIGLKYGGGQEEKAGIIMVGRDIGTVVMPEAPLKLYLEATAEARAQRRYVEQKQRGKSIDYAQVLADIRLRDRLDSQRVHAPLRPAGDAIMIDTSALTIDEVVSRVVQAMVQATEKVK
ncbi:MAG: (d)CMP kinase [Chloroflexota bacterium]